MKETDFIKQNTEKWAQNEALFDRKVSNPDQVSEAFTEITEDLSFARTFYPYRSVRVYLNQMAQAIYFKLNIRRFNPKKILRFWTDELPMAMVEARKDMNMSLAIFILGTLIGVVSTVYDPDFPRIILGDRYVDMTLENIANDDPMKVYKDASPFDMFFGITLNNLRVAYITFVLGILFSVGSAFMIFYNAIMLGSFQFFFFQNAVFAESVLAIWLHGTLEISAIILAGGAGLTLGRGLLFPGTLSRALAFQVSAQRGLKVMLGITPVFIMAAFIESFATRFTEAPDLLRLLIILSSLAIILGYYVYYPWKKAQSGFSEELEKFKLPPYTSDPIQIDEVKSVGSLFTDTFKMIGKLGTRPLWVAFISALILSVYFIYTNRNNDLVPLVSYDFFITNLERYFTHFALNLPFWINDALFTLIMGSVIWGLNRVYGLPAISIKRWAVLPVIVLAWHALFLINSPGVWWAVIFLTPLFFLFISGWFDTRYKLTFNHLFRNVFTLLQQTLLLNLLILLVSFILFFVAYTPLIYFYLDVIKINIELTDKNYMLVLVGLITLTLSFVFFLMVILLLTAMSLMYFHINEVKEANGLRARILAIKTKKLAYGLERENH